VYPEEPVQNPILTVFKIVAFGFLAFLVWISFWQGLRQEDRVLKVETQLSQIREDLSEGRLQARQARDAVNRLAGSVDALTGVIESGALAGRAPGPVGGGAPRAAPAPRRGPEGLGDGNTILADCPSYFSDAARELWGQRDLYLEPDPDHIIYPALDAEGVDPHGRLNRWFQSQPSDINPITASDALVQIRLKEYCLRYIAQRHVRNAARYKPQLAIRVEVNKPDYTEWVVWLRNDVYWHKPQVDLDKYPHLKGRHKLTAHDVKFTLDAILNPDTNAAHIRNYYSECEGIEVIDDFCYVMRWSKPQYNSITYTLMLEPIPEFVFAYDEAGNRFDEGQFGVAFNDHWFPKANHFIGCGPYFVAEFDPSSHMLIKRNDGYYGQMPPIGEIYMEIFPERQLSVKKLESGEHDFGSLSVKDWEKKVVKEKGQNPFSDGRMDEHWLWGVSYSFIGWKNTHPIFKDVEVRTAMTLACNRERIRDVLELGKAKITTGPQHVNSPFNPPDLEPLLFDLELAKAKLATAGWTDTDGDGVLDKVLDGAKRDFRFTAMVPNNQLFIPIFEIFKADLHKIGVEMELDMLLWKQFKERLDSRRFECTALLWSGDGWESDLTQIWHSSQIDEVPSSNFCEYSDPESDRLMEKLRTVFEFDERVRLQRKLHERIASLQPYTFLMTYRQPVMWWKARLGNVPAGCVYADRPPARTYTMYRKVQK
jgi:ABC-type transport system substrate-binding protein